MKWSKRFRPGVRALLLVALGASAGCVRPGAPAAPADAPEVAPARASAAASASQLSISTAESLLTVAVRRGGPLARLGHNHVIAMRDISGTVRMDADPASASFEWTQPVGLLTVDEPTLRAAAGSDFSAPVPDDARAGTRANMLGASLLQAEQFPLIRVAGTVARRLSSDEVELSVDVQLRGQATRLVLPVRWGWRDASTLEVEGGFELRQTQLGLTPFSVMMGALQVEDPMRLDFKLVARATPEASR